MKSFLLSFLGSLLALIILIALVGGGVIIKTKQKPKIEDHSWLVIDLHGEILEYAPPCGLMGKITGGESETLHRILGNLEKVRYDERIEGVLLKIGNCKAGGAMREEIRGAVKKVQVAGKKVYGYSDQIDRGGFYLAAACDEIYMPPTAYISFTGLGATSTHIRGTLDKLGIKPNLHQIKDYKSAAEMITRKDLSPAARENIEWMLVEFWDMITQAIMADRGLTEQQIVDMMDLAVFSAEEAKEGGFIDGLMYWDEIEEMLKREDDDELRTVSQSRYAEVERKKFGLKGDQKIAVVHAQGLIAGRDSRVDPLLGMIMGYESVVADLRRAREDEDVVAIIFRVDSGGGDALTSDLIGHEVENCSLVKPIVCSMVNVAASGGYDIAYRASKIMADPTTVTGSIGSISGKFNVKGFHDKIGLTHDTVTKGPNALFWSDTRDFTEEEWERFTKDHWRGFNDWLRDVAEHRGMSFEEAEKLAHGRVWTGRQAVGNGLIDELGGLDRAIALAKELAGVPAEEEVTLLHYPEAEDFLGEILGGGGVTAAVNWAIYRYIREDLTETWRLLAGRVAQEELIIR